jgi:hypothetical protein
MAQELQVIQDFQDLSVYLTARVLTFPRGVRYGLGLAMEQRLQVLLALLIRAKYASPAGKAPHLREANVELEVLRFQLRQALEVKALPIKSHRHAIERLTQVGNQVGGWLKALAAAAGRQGDGREALR